MNKLELVGVPLLSDDKSDESNNTESECDEPDESSNADNESPDCECSS